VLVTPVRSVLRSNCRKTRGIRSVERSVLGGLVALMLF
jgi:hypothetical protein